MLLSFAEAGEAIAEASEAGRTRQHLPLCICFGARPPSYGARPRGFDARNTLEQARKVGPRPRASPRAEAKWARSARRPLRRMLPWQRARGVHPLGHEGGRLLSVSFSHPRFSTHPQFVHSLGPLGSPRRESLPAGVAGKRWQDVPLRGTKPSFRACRGGEPNVPHRSGDATAEAGASARKMTCFTRGIRGTTPPCPQDRTSRPRGHTACRYIRPPPPHLRRTFASVLRQRPWTDDGALFQI